MTAMGAMALGVAMATLANRPHSEAIVAEAFWLVWRRAASIDAQTPRAEQWLGGLAHYLVVQRRSQIIPH